MSRDSDWVGDRFGWRLGIVRSMAKRGGIVARIIGIRYNKKAEADCDQCSWRTSGEPGPVKTKARSHAVNNGHTVDVVTSDLLRYQGME